MSLKPCKECGKQISSTAGKCPHCGAVNTAGCAKATGIGCLSVIAIFIAVTIFVWLTETPQKPSIQDNAKVDLSKAQPYTIIRSGDFSFPGRLRLEWVITSTADTFESRAQTAMKAAMELQKQKGADVVNIWYEISPKMEGYQLAIARYAPDGGGFSGDPGQWKWQVEATDMIYSQLSVRSRELWETYKDRFRESDGCINEAGLKVFIAENLNIGVDQVEPLWISRNKYMIE